jgi:hypothetical protein
MIGPVGFKFPLDQSDQWDGFNDSGIEHFSGNPYVHLGREVVQNTLDARRTGSVAPAHVFMQLAEVPTDSIPDVGSLRETLGSCRVAAKNESQKAEIFFDNAIELLTKSKITVLKISDYNTTGVCGPCQNGTPYYALMKASGQSKKTYSTAAGSYGIGKYAPFAVSELRTVFVTTIWQANSEWYQYVQGKSILMSHQSKSGNTEEGVGFWGIKERCLPVEVVPGELPEWLLRSKTSVDYPKNVGTTLSILGFPADKDWARILAATIIENFFGAIHRGQIDVVIQGDIFINADTVESLFNDSSIRSAIEQMKDQPDHFDGAAFYQRALTNSDNVIVEQTENQNLGNCELRILLGENLPKRVAVLRNGMLITEELEGLRKFSDFKDFVAVLECKSTKGNELLRAMEPPRHDAFEPERLPTDRDKRRGRLALKELSKWVKDMLKRHAQNPASEVTPVDELAAYFADEGEGGTLNRSGEENPDGRLTIRARPLKRKDRTTTYASTTGADGSDEGEELDEGEEEPTPPAGPTNQNDGGTSHAGRSGGTEHHNSPVGVKLLNVRAVPLSDKRRKIAFTPDYSGDLSLTLEDSGADRNYRLKILSASSGIVKHGKIEKLTVTAGGRYTVDVEFDREFLGSVRVSADAV